MRERTTKPGSTLLLMLLAVLMLLLIASRLSFDGKLGWRPFGEPRHSFAHGACGIPIHVALGEVDPRFGYDRATVSRAMSDAAGLWQASVAETLFLDSAHPRAMAVSLEFDDRQQSANLRRSLRSGIDRNRSQLESEEAALKRSSDRIEFAQRLDAQEREALEARVMAHEVQVAQWNADAPSARHPARGHDLEREGAQIRAAFIELGRARESLNREIEAHNQQVRQRREQSAALQGNVDQYNAFASDQPIESGRYSHDREQGRRIAVFRAADYNELVWILAHEFGHALGLLHVEQPGAVMNALLHEGAGKRGRAAPVALRDADLAALEAVCGDRLRRRSRT